MTEDKFKGFRPLASPSGHTRFWLCVSKENKFDSNKRYDPPDGYEWALTDMWNSNTIVASSSEFTYYNQGGWSYYTFGGVQREHFVFADSTTTKKCVNVGNYLSTSTAGWHTTDRFAGIVVIKKDSWDNARSQFKY